MPCFASTDAAIAERAPLYRAVADLEIDTGSTDPVAAAERVVERLSDRG